MPKLNQKCLTASGLNDRFYGDDLSFENYIELMQNIIVESRLDLDDDNAGQIVIANSPFSWETSPQKQQDNGILLVHGLFDSPFYVRDLGKYFRNKGFLVNAILLPGHGTVAGDLLNINYEEWLKSLHYGISKLQSSVKNVYLAGYSLGGLLALQGALTNPELIKGLILLAPALKSRSPIKFFLAKHYRLFSWMSKRAQWYQLKASKNFTRYSCYPYNAGYQASKLLYLVNEQLKSDKLKVPFFVVMSHDDETVSPESLLSFFEGYQNPKNRLLIYTNNQIQTNDKRIISRPSFYPELKILNFSHTCLTISPDNPLLGAKSRMVDFNHYRNLDETKLEGLHHGATNKENLKKSLISRLSYNPDFNFMIKQIDEFLKQIG